MILTLRINNNMNPLNNKYAKWYYRLIEFAQRRNLSVDSYKERHHIIPRSLGGNNRKENIVDLLPREHFVAHLLLSKMFDGQEKFKMWKAFNMMLTENTAEQARYAPTSRFYELARKLVGVASSECNKGRIPWNKGIPRSETVKKAVSDANKGKIPWNKGSDRSANDKQRMKDGWAKRIENGFVPHNKGKKQTVIVCENCGDEVGGVGNYTRWHGTNCKKGK